MTNIRVEVQKILAGDICIQRDLNRRLINIRGLAKYLVARHLPDATVDSVISAIRRFRPEHYSESRGLERVFKDAVVSTKNYVACLTLSANAFPIISRVLEKKLDKQGVFRVIRGARTLKFIVDQHNLEELLSCFQEPDIVKIEKNLGEVSISVHPKAEKIKGVLAKMVNEISIHDINIIEMLVCIPELRVFVKQSDLVKVHQIMLELFQKK